MADGNTSFDDCDALTWSLGCTAPASPSFSEASVASTSFMFMFDDVPEPVWNTSTGNCSSQHAVGDLGRGRRDGVGDARCRPAGTSRRPALTSRGLALDERQRPDEPALDRQSRDREVLDRPLGLCAPLGVGRDPTSPIESCSMR